MHWRTLLLTILSLGVLGVAGWAVTAVVFQDDASDESDEIASAPTATNRVERLSVGIINGEAQTCYFDADVRLQEGKVGVLDRADALGKDHIRSGDIVPGLPAGLDEYSNTIPVPVYVGADGKVRGGYAYCERDGELSVGRIVESTDGEETFIVCSIDAMVSLEDGTVGAVEAVAAPAKERIRPGDRVADVPEELQVGTTLPAPVYIDDDGTLRAGMGTCN